MTMQKYSCAGMIIDSVFALPALASAPSLSGEAQMCFRRVNELLPINGASGIGGPNWSYVDGLFDLHVPEVAQFRIHGDGTVEVLAKTANEKDIATFLIGSVMGIALHLQSIIALHASAVCVGDGAILFCGPSGAGKSTMAAVLQKRGRDVLCDDLCAIRQIDGRAMLYADSRRLKLWDRAIEKIGLEELKGETVRDGFGKYFLGSEARPIGPRPVRGIYILSNDRRITEPRITSAPLVEAATLIRRNAYRPFLIRELKDEKLYFDATTLFIRESGVFRLERDHDFTQLDQVADLLETHWHDQGLA